MVYNKVTMTIVQKVIVTIASLITLYCTGFIIGALSQNNGFIALSLIAFLFIFTVIFLYELWGKNPKIKKYIILGIVLILLSFFVVLLSNKINHPKLDYLGNPNIPAKEPIFTPTKTPPLIIPANNNGSWHQVLSFSGSSPKTSDQFKIKGNQWKISYQISSGSYNLGMVTIKTENRTSIESDLIEAKGNADEYKIENGRGMFYITADPINNASYTIQVEDYY